MVKKNTLNKCLKWAAGIAVAPIVLFLLLALLVYMPPVQNFAVRKATAMLSETTGMNISIGSLRLAFPLDLALHNLLATQDGDTLIDARSARVDVRLLPLFEGRADIDALSLYDASLDTKALVPDVRVKGRVGELTAASHGVEWMLENVNLDAVALKHCDLWVELADTAQKDTTASEAQWKILLDKAEIANTSLRLSMPGDTMRLAAYIGEAALYEGNFNTGSAYYAFRRLLLQEGFVKMQSGTMEESFFSWLPQLPQTLPATGAFNPSDIALSRLHLAVDTLSFDSAATLRANIAQVSFAEQSGVEVKSLSGSVYMDSVRLEVPAFHFATAHSRLDAGISVNWRALQAGADGHCRLLLDAALGHEDVRALGAGFLAPEYLKAYPNQTLTLKATASGNTHLMLLENVECALPGMVQLKGAATLQDVMKTSRRGDARFSLATGNLTPLMGFLPADVRSMIALPNPMKADGRASFAGDDYKADMRMAAEKGLLTAQAAVNVKREVYDIAVDGQALPLSSFLPEMGLGNFSGHLVASGAGFDMLSPSTVLKAEAVVDSFAYNGWPLHHMKLTANLAESKGEAHFESDNELLQGSGTFTAALADMMNFSLAADMPLVDVARLGGMKDTLQMGVALKLDAHADQDLTDYGVEGSVANIRFYTPTKSIPTTDLDFVFATDSTATNARLASGDLSLRLAAKGGLDSLVARALQFVDSLNYQLDNKMLNQTALKSTLPEASFFVNAGEHNPMSNILRYMGYTYNGVYVNLSAHPEKGLSGQANVGNLKAATLLLDTVHFDIRQEPEGMVMDGTIHNFTRRNPNKFEARLRAYLLASGAGVETAFFDSQGRMGIDLGLRADIAKGGLNVKLYPEHPVIAYRGFTVNPDNYIFLGRDQTIKADVDLLADDGTGLKIYGEPVDSVNDITLSLNRLNLGELSNVLPYLPKLDGLLSGDFHLTDDHKKLSAMASITTQQLCLEGMELGDVGLEAIYLPKDSLEHFASAFINYNGQDVMECNGTYINDAEGHFNGEALLHDFPLQMLNGFLAGTDVSLDGTAVGNLALSGTLSTPEMNGQLDLNTAKVCSEVYGFEFKMDERPVLIENSKMRFENYSLYSTGRSPLVIDGVLDMSNLSDMGIDFRLQAENFELINTKKKARSTVYGKVYTNFNATVRGSANDLIVRGKLDILDRTDMTYILKDSPISVDDRLNDLVQFVSFEDTTTVESVPVPTTKFDLTMGVSVSDMAQFHCNLSEDGQNYVDLEGGGNLTLRLTQQGDMRVTGRFTTTSGEMKYALPIIPLKTFKLVPGSYVEFTGDVMNPTLNVAAKERVKAVVTENEQSRSVAFDVGVAITKPLSDMGLEFTIEAPEDLTIQNQLASMTPEQRGKTAVTMLATGMYLTDDNMNNGGFKANNALNAFLQSEIQNIAGSALRTIDINLGVESGTSAVGTSTTDYSFQFSKRFWGNRISVIVGGKVSTGADAQNSAASIIDNISVEYRLDKSATRYVRVFYDRDTQDPLEGQLMKTGAGLVLRRKTDRLGELFLFKKK